MLNHLDMKKKLKELDLVSSFDYVRSVNQLGWTDFYLNSASKILDVDSKYIITSTYHINKNQNANILYIPSLVEVINEVKDRFQKNKDSDGFDLERNRVLGHFIDENIIQFGNKTGNHFNLELKSATLEDLVNKEKYSLKMSHEEIQWHLIVLGLSFGLGVKVARNDKSKIFNGNILSHHATLSINDLPLPDMVYEIYLETKKKIDYIDIIWVDRISNKIVSAFEVELSGNITEAIMRLVELRQIYQSDFISVIVGSVEDFHKISRIGSLFSMKGNIRNLELQYLTKQNLIEAVKFNYKYGGLKSGLWDFFFNKLLKKVSEHGLHYYNEI
jgi:hypothetical protein